MKYVAVTSFTHNGKSISDGYVIDKVIYGYTDADIYSLITQGKVKAVDDTVKQNVAPQKVQSTEEVKVVEETVSKKVEAVEEKIEEEVKVVDNIKTFSFSKKSKKK